LGSVLPAALLLAADRALLATAFSRATRDADEVARDRARGSLNPPRFRAWAANFKSALRQRGVSRRLSVPANLQRLGLRGLLGAVRQAGRFGSAPQEVSRRVAYDLSRGTPPADLDSRREPVPPGAAAALLGVHDFLLNLPVLSDRRAWLQSARQRSDREILSRFDRHWTAPVATPHQLIYEQLQRTLIDTFGVADVTRGETEAELASAAESARGQSRLS